MLPGLNRGKVGMIDILVKGPTGGKERAVTKRAVL